MNKLKEMLTLNKALEEYNNISKEAESMDAKHLLLSKTFWLNVVGLGVTLSGILPQKYGMPALAILNIINRLVTNQPVTLSIPWGK